MPPINKSEETTLFGHVKHTAQCAGAAWSNIHLSVTMQQDSGQFGTWRRIPGRPQKHWVEEVTTSPELSPSDAGSVRTDSLRYDGSVSMEGAATRRRLSVERERDACL